MQRFCIPLKVRPKRVRHGAPLAALPKSMYDTNDEIALGIRFVAKRALFGQCFAGVLPDCYYAMGSTGGVMIGAFVPSTKIMRAMKFPGDVDLLVIPYEDNQLIISETLAIELKAVRARFSNQGKSPNQFGFSQANALLSHGFPYSAVGHLIVSDPSPRSHWRETHMLRILDADEGTVDSVWPTVADLLPSVLIDRCFGRLQANCKNDLLGLFAAYITDDGMWFPSARPARQNALASTATMEAIAECYERDFDKFLDTPKY